MNNQTMQFLPAELYFSMGRIAAISSLLCIVILALIIIFLLFFQQRQTSRFDEHELQSDTEQSITENRTLELSNLKQYSSTDINQLMTTATSMHSFHSEIDQQLAGSKTNLISSN
jgi:predicted PurR-regulated permease PerM